MKRSQVRWLGHLLTNGGTSILPQGKIGVGRPRLCEERLDLTCPDVIASIKDRNRWNHLSVSRKANENKNVCLSFSYLMLLFTCQSICQLFNYIMKKCKRTFSSTFLFLSTESSACSLSYQKNEFLFSHWFISNSVWNQRDKSWRRNSFFLTVKSQTSEMRCVSLTRFYVMTMKFLLVF